MSAAMSAPAPAPPEVRNYAIVTLAYWADTLADGATRTLVLFYFYQLGYNALQVASCSSSTKSSAFSPTSAGAGWPPVLD